MRVTLLWRTATKRGIRNEREARRVRGRKRGWPGHRRAEATPSFGRLCPAMTEMVGALEQDQSASRHCEPTGRRKAPPDDRLREAIQGGVNDSGLLRFARNDDQIPFTASYIRTCPAGGRRCSWLWRCRSCSLARWRP